MNNHEFFITGFYEAKTYPIECAFVKTLSLKPHIHTEWELIINIKGRISAFINGIEHIAEESQMVLIPPNQLHYYESELGEYIVFTFNTDMIPMLKKQFTLERPQNSVVSFCQIENICNSIHALINFSKQSEYMSGDFLEENIALSYLNLILTLSIHLFDFSVVNIVRYDLISEIIDYCLNNFKNKVSLDVISKELNISKSHISHLFNSEMKIPLPTFINLLRVADACRLFRHTNLTITEVAYEEGFGSLRAFNRIFISFMNMTPTEYKKSFIGGRKIDD